METTLNSQELKEAVQKGQEILGENPGKPHAEYEDDCIQAAIGCRFGVVGSVCGHSVCDPRNLVKDYPGYNPGEVASSIVVEEEEGGSRVVVRNFPFDVPDQLKSIGFKTAVILAKVADGKPVSFEPDDGIEDDEVMNELIVFANDGLIRVFRGNGGREVVVVAEDSLVHV